MSRDMVIYRTRPNYGHTHSSAIRRYYNELTNTGETAIEKLKGEAPEEQREGTIHTLVESGATGGVLGALHGTLRNGLDVHRIPVDGVLGAVGVIASKLLHGNVGRSVHAVSDRAFAIWAFRGTTRLVAARHHEPAGKTAGIHGDELREAAKAL